jgi:hypothetical protein
MIRALRRAHRVWAVVLLLGGALALAVSIWSRPARPAPTTIGGDPRPGGRG